MDGVFLRPGEGETVEVGSGGPFDPGAMAEIASKHDFVPVGQP